MKLSFILVLLASFAAAQTPFQPPLATRQQQGLPLRQQRRAKILGQLRTAQGFEGVGLEGTGPLRQMRRANFLQPPLVTRGTDAMPLRQQRRANILAQLPHLRNTLVSGTPQRVERRAHVLQNLQDTMPVTSGDASPQRLQRRASMLFDFDEEDITSANTAFPAGSLPARQQRRADMLKKAAMMRMMRRADMGEPMDVNWQSQFQPSTIAPQYRTSTIAPLSNEVSSVATEFGQLITQATGADAFQRMMGQLRLFEEDAVVQNYAVGLTEEDTTFRSHEGIKQMMKQITTAMDIQTQTFRLLGVNEEDGLALMNVRITGTAKKTGKPVDLETLVVLEVDTVTRKIQTMLIVNKNKKEAHDAFQTQAEKWLEDLVNEFFQSDSEELLDGTAPVWSRLSDNIKIKVNMYPEVFNKNTWTGKQEIIQHFREAREKNFVFMDKLPELLEQMDFKILHSTDNEVWTKMTWPGFGEGAIKHYVFDNQGRVLSEEITMLGNLLPWEIYPMPFHGQQQQQHLTGLGDKLKGLTGMGLGNVLDKEEFALSIHGNVDELTQIGTMKFGPIMRTTFDNEFEFEGVGAEGNKDNKLSGGGIINLDQTLQLPRDIPTTWGEGNTFPSTGQTGEQEYCDSTSNQKCQSGMPCREPHVKCETPERCLCL